MKTHPNTKVFNGKRYTFRTWYNNNTDAMNKARSLRKGGIPARVTKFYPDDTKSKLRFPKFLLWIRKKGK